MLIRKMRDIPAAEITPQSLYVHRREFLFSTGAAIAVLATGGLRSVLAAADPLAIARRMVTTTDPLTPYKAVTTYNNFYEFGSDKGDAARHAAAFTTKPWSVAVSGLCGKPGTYTLEDILKPHSLEERVYRHRCVEGWSMVVPWIGFPLGDLLKRFEPAASAQYRGIPHGGAARRDARSAREMVVAAAVAVQRRPADGRSDAPADARRGRLVRRLAAESERRPAAPHRPMEIRLQGHQVDCRRSASSRKRR